VFRNGATTYGTTSTVGHLRAILNRLEAWPLPHRLVIGDLSTRGGGPLLGHRSHQTGRDVDIGFFYRRSPGRKFVEATPDGLDLPSTFALLAALAETQADPSGVQWILLDYRIQHQLYAWAQGQGIDPSTLDRWFQYPHGKRADRGLIRHYPNHRHHMHVRFGCGHEDKACVSPPGPPT
jgi:murein endopeptidase